MSNYEPVGRWKVLDENGDVWCETGDENDARKRMRPGDNLFQLTERVEHIWVLVYPTPYPENFVPPKKADRPKGM